jgi:hypothetical protein
LRTALVGAAAFALLASPFAIGKAAAGVGVTSATDGDPLGKPPAEAERVLRIGIDVQANELITTSTNDRAHLVFLDGSSLTVGPNAQLTIDKFVYDPATKTGELAINASKGVFRLVGGKISKTRPIAITTPSSTIGIRGGITILDVKPNQTDSTFVFGNNMTVNAGGQTQNVTRPGSQVITNAGSPPGRPTIAAQGALAAQLGQLEGRRSGQGGGGGGAGSGRNADQAAQDSGFSATNSGQSVRITGLRPGDSFGSGPGPSNWNPTNVVTTALGNANDVQQQQQSQAQQLEQAQQLQQLQQLPQSQADFDKLITNPGGTPTSVSEINALTSTATYSGPMVGVVNNRSVAFGSYQNTWNFGARNGVATVTFDNARFGGGTTPNTFSPGNNGVSFRTPTPLPSTGGPARTLDLHGVFVSKPGSPASHQVGNFSITGQNYKADGVFVGQK